MKRSIILIFIFFLFINLIATQDRSPFQTKVAIPETDDMWDVLLQFDVDTPTGQVGLAGMEWDGTYFYASKWSGSDQLFKFDADGNYIEAITAPLTGCRDMAFDGTYMYGSPASQNVSCWESETGVAVPENNTFVAGASVRALAYDETSDTFWSGNWSDNIVRWNRNGTILESHPWWGSLYGLAYDYQFGPHLYAHSQDTGCVVYQLDPNNALAQLEVMDFTSIGGVGAIAGGACFMSDWGNYSNIFTLGLLLQGSPDYIAVVEIYFWGGLEAPSSPENVIIQPDENGTLETFLSWTCPAINVVGNPLIELLDMLVYRNDELIYTDENPIIGGPGNYLDTTVPDNGMYEYKVVGYNSWGQGIPYTESVWVGEDVPAAVEELTLHCGINSFTAILTWENPTSGLYGGAFNEPIIGYHIERNDGVVFELAGINTYYIDCTVPTPGILLYTVQTYNSIGDGGIAENTINWSNFGLDEDFSTEFPPVGWNIEGGDNWELSFTNEAGGSIPEAVFSTPYSNEIQRLISYSMNSIVATAFAVEFKQLVTANVGGSYALSLQTSSDGIDWHTCWQIEPAGNIEPEEIQLVLPSPDLGSENFQLAWTCEGEPAGFDAWYIDDISVQMRYFTGFVEGNVVLNGGNGNVLDVLISTGNHNTQPDANGDYLLDLYQGIFDITASLENYEPVTIDNVSVEIGEITTGIDFTLNYNGSNTNDELIAQSGITSIYPNPFNPTTTISFSTTETIENTEIGIYNLKGQRAKDFSPSSFHPELVEGRRDGRYSIIWNGTNDSGKIVSSGIYFCRFKCGDVVQTKRMLLLK